MRFRVMWGYKSSLGGPWGEGLEIDLDEVLANAINDDSPGVLVPAEGESAELPPTTCLPAAEPAESKSKKSPRKGRKASAKGQRQVNAARNRAKTEVEDDR